MYTVHSEENLSGELHLLSEGQARIHQLQVLLAGSDVGCFRIRGEVFDDALVERLIGAEPLLMFPSSFFDSRAPVELYDSFAHSPVLRHFTFSPTVLSIINRIIPDIAPDNTLYEVEASARATSAIPLRTSQWRQVLALHLRRGDGWERVCEEKGMRSA